MKIMLDTTAYVGFKRNDVEAVNMILHAIAGQEWTHPSPAIGPTKPEMKETWRNVRGPAMLECSRENTKSLDSCGFLLIGTCRHLK